MWTAAPPDALRPYVTLYSGYQELVAPWKAAGASIVTH